MTDSTTVGAYWHTEQKHTFENFVRFGVPPNPFQSVARSLPSVYGVGVANTILADGRLLLAADFTYLEWADTDFFGAFWKDQFTVQTGMQYTICSGCKFRLGYTYAQNASKNVIAPEIGGVTRQAGVDYIQALFPNANEHRIRGGVGMSILPGVDVDLFAGGMFEVFGLFSHPLEDDFSIVIYNFAIDYYINHNFVVDFRAGAGLTPDSDDFFSGVGGGYRF